MVPARWSLRTWLVLLAFLFVVLEFNCMRYGMYLRATASDDINELTGQIVPLILAHARQAPDIIYVTPREMMVVQAWQAAALAVMLIMLTLIVRHGVICRLADKAKENHRARWRAKQQQE